MKKRLTRGEKWLFASPLLFLAIAGIALQRQNAAPASIELPANVKVRQLQFSPDGRQLVMFDYNFTSRQFEGQISDLASPSENRDLEMPPILEEENHVGNPVWSPDKQSVAVRFRLYSSPHFVSRILIWDAKNGLLKFDHRYLCPLGDRPDRKFVFSQDGKTLRGEGWPPLRCDLASGRRLDKPSESAGPGGLDLNLAYVNEKLKLAALPSFSDKSTLKVFDMRTGRVVWQLKRSELQEWQWFGDVLCLCYNAYGSAGSRPVQNNLVLWNGKTRQLMPAPPVPFGTEIGDFCFNPDGSSVTYFTQRYERVAPATITSGGHSIVKMEMVVWDYRSHRALTRASIVSIPMNLQPSPNGKWLAGVDNKVNNGIVVFDKFGKLRFKFPKNDKPFCWSPDSKQLASSVRELINGESVRTKRLQIYRLED